MNKFIVILLVCLASTNALQVQSVEAKGIVDLIINTFNLQSVWDEISNLGGAVFQQLQGVLTQLLFAGQEKWNQAQQIFQTLIYDLTNHIGNSSDIVTQAIASITQILSNGNGKRGLADLLSTLGLDQIWQQIQDVGANLLGQFTAEITQILLSGQQVLQQAKPILAQLQTDLINHIGDAKPILTAAVQQLAQILSNGGKRDLADFFLNTLGLGQIWQQIQDVGANLLGQFTAEITQLIFAGQQVLQQAKPILAQLQNDLVNHLGNASDILSAAVQQLAQVLNGGNGKRGIVDLIINTFNLQSVWDEISNLGGAVFQQLQGVLTQLLFAGQEKWNQAQQIFQTLIYDLTNHIGNSSDIVQQAIASITQILSNGNGKRGLKRLIR